MPSCDLGPASAQCQPNLGQGCAAWCGKADRPVDERAGEGAIRGGGQDQRPLKNGAAAFGSQIWQLLSTAGPAAAC